MSVDTLTGIFIIIHLIIIQKIFIKRPINQDCSQGLHIHAIITYIILKTLPTINILKYSP